MDSVDLKWHQDFIFIIVVYIGMLFINWKHITSVFHKKAGNTNCRSIDQPRYYNKLFGQFRSIWVNFLWRFEVNWGQDHAEVSQLTSIVSFQALYGILLPCAFIWYWKINILGIEVRLRSVIWPFKKKYGFEVSEVNRVHS